MARDVVAYLAALQRGETGQDGDESRDRLPADQVAEQDPAPDGVERTNSTFTIATLHHESCAPATYDLDTLLEELTE